MGIEGADREPRLGDAPPAAKSGAAIRPVRTTRSVVSSSGTARSGTWVVTSTTRSSLRGEHHRDIDVAREVGQPLGVSRIGKAGEMERVLVGGRGDDRVHFAWLARDRAAVSTPWPAIRPARAARPRSAAPVPSPDP